MELTIEKALELGVNAHNAGNLQEAERIYRAILETDRNQANANYNLGSIAVFMQNSKAAIPLFKIAIKAMPEIENFWISYIAALLKENQIKLAKKALKEYKQQSSSTEHLVEISKSIDAEILQPSPAESELKQLANYYQDGSLAATEDLAKSIVLEFPTNFFAWNILGATLKQLGRLNDALSASLKAAELTDKNDEVYINLGEILYLSNREEDALDSYEKAIRLNPESLRANFELGILYLRAGRHIDSELCFKRVIKSHPENAWAHNNLGGVYIELGRLDKAERSYSKAIALNPAYFDALVNLGDTLQLLGRLQEAEGSYKRALAVSPDSSRAHYLLGKLLFENKKYSQAIEEFKSLDFEDSEIYLLKCLYCQDRQDEFYDQLGIELSRGKINAVIGSLTSRSAIRYGIDKSNPFCQNPLDYVFTTDLKEVLDFKNKFVSVVEGFLADKSVINRGQGLLHNGVQTAGNLFNVKGDLLIDVELILRSEIEKYRVHFENSQEGFIKDWPRQYKISGWLVSMKDGGSLDAHMHDSGWLTGGVYINVPPKIEPDAGNLVVSIGDEDDSPSNENMMSIDVVTGSLCLFPASLLHYTIPFNSVEDRIVLAFDVIPD